MPYLEDPSLEAYIPTLLCPFFSNAILSYNSRAGKSIAEWEWWDSFRPCIRTCWTGTLFSHLLPAGAAYQVCILHDEPGQGLLSKQTPLLLLMPIGRPPQGACQVQALGKLMPGSVEVRVSCHSIAIDRKGWHASRFSGQPDDCFPKVRAGASSCIHCAFSPPVRLFIGLPVSKIRFDGTWQVYVTYKSQ